jgi:hypothetical protein
MNVAGNVAGAVGSATGIPIPQMKKKSDKKKKKDKAFDPDSTQGGTLILNIQNKRYDSDFQCHGFIVKTTIAYKYFTIYVFILQVSMLTGEF